METPDILQTAEKIWFGAVYAIKKLYLSVAIDLRSHNSLNDFCKFALVHCVSRTDIAVLTEYWTNAQKYYFKIFDFNYKYLNKECIKMSTR